MSRPSLPAPHFTWFSYPGGSHDERVVQTVRRKFSGAVSVILGKPDEPWQMNWIAVDRDSSFSALDISELRAVAWRQP